MLYVLTVVVTLCCGCIQLYGGGGGGSRAVEYLWEPRIHKLG
jgi:hypothetical protein